MKKLSFIFYLLIISIWSSPAFSQYNISIYNSANSTPAGEWPAGPGGVEIRAVLAPAPGVIPLNNEPNYLVTTTTNSPFFSTITFPYLWFSNFPPTPSWYNSGDAVWAYVQCRYVGTLWTTASGRLNPAFSGTTTEAYVNAAGFVNVAGGGNPGLGLIVNWIGMNYVQLH